MASYFTSTYYTAYLPAEISGRGDIDALAGECEADVIAHYTRTELDPSYTVDAGSRTTINPGYVNMTSTEGTVTTYLRYYKTDADDVGATDVEQAFKTAMRREIAGVVMWRARQWDANQITSSEARGQRAWSYRPDGMAPFPPGFGRFLKPYDRRPVPFAI